MSKPARIDRFPEVKEQVCLMTADGASQEQIAKEVGVSDRGTIARWQQREDVKARVAAILQDRTIRIRTHTTSRIEKLLQSGKNIPLKELLEIERTFGGNKLLVNQDEDGSGAMAALHKRAAEDPEFAAALATLGMGLNDDDAD